MSSCCITAKEEEKLLRHVQLFATPWTVAYQALPSMGFSRQEYWSGLPFSSPGDLAHPENKLGSLALQADSLKTEPPGKLLCHSQEDLLMSPYHVPGQWDFTTGS